jgi:hypothetical protein
MQNPINKKAEKRFDNSTLSLLRANPKLSGNIKLVIDSNSNVFLSTFEFINNLAQAEKLKYVINPNEPLNISISNFIKNTLIDKDILYTNYRKKDDLNVSNDFYDFYDDGYLAGVKYKDSLQYVERLSAFYPIWLRKNIPSHFFIFKANGAFSKNGNSKNFNTNNIQDWINDFHIIKTFDLSENSNVGKLLRSLIENKKWSDDCLVFNPNGQSEYIGISLTNGAISGAYEDINKSLYNTDKIILEKNDIVTRGFYRNELLCANAINIEFLFDDDASGTMDRYFGLYADFDEISKFYINAQRAKDVINETDLNVWNNLNTKSRLIKNNTEKLRIFTDSTNNLIEPTELQTQRFWTVKTSNSEYYSVSNDAWTLPNNDNLDVVLKTKQIDLNNFTTFEIFNENIICEKLNKHISLPSFRADLISVPNDGDSIRIRYTNPNDVNFIDNADAHTIVASSLIPAGTFVSNNFSNLGNLDTICFAIIKCLENLDTNFGTAYTAISYGFNKLLFISKIQSFIRNNAVIEFYTSSVTPKFKFYENYITAPANNYTLSPIDALVTTNIGVVTKGKMLGSFSQNCIKIKRSDVQLILNVLNPFVQNSDKNFNALNINNIDAYNKPIITQYTETLKLDVFDNFVVNSDAIEYVLIVLDIVMPTSKKLQIFKKVPNYVGLLSINPICDYDFELENSIYSNSIVTDRIALNDFLISGSANGFNTLYPTPLNNPIILQNVYSNNTEYVLNGELFKMSDFDFDSEPYLSEYDRFKEYYLKETSNSSKTSQWIVRWSSKYLNARDVPYGLKTSKATGATNFTPSFKEFSINAKFLTHDWLLLCGVPPYYNTNITNAKDRIFLIPNFENSYLTNNYFQTYLEIKTINNIEIHEYNLYSIINKNNSEFNTMFRGVVVQPYKKANTVPINNNIDNINVTDFNFEGYKFAAILIPSSPGYKIRISRNDIEKTILLCVECDIFDDVSNKYTNGIDTFTYIDRVQLYTNYSKFIHNGLSNDIEYADVSISGSIESWSVSNTGVITFFGNTHLLNNTTTDFENEIYPISSGVFDKIVIIAGLDILEIENIIKITSTTIQATSFKINSLPINVSSSVLSVSMTYGYIVPALRTANYVYKNGGFNANLRLLEKICFANIASLINDGNPKIEYIAKLKNGNIVENDFYLNLNPPSQIIMNSYLTRTEDDRPAVLRNTYDTIGYKIVNNSSTITENIFAYGGNMSPLFKQILHFSIEPQNTNLENLFFRNTKILNTTAQYLTYFNKVSVNNTARILTQSANDFLPQYPKINETPIDKFLLSPLISSFDYGFYLESLSKNIYEKVFGILSKKLNKSVLSSVVMLSNKSYTFTTFDAVNTTDPTNFEILSIADRNEIYIYQSTENVVCEFDIDKCLVNKLKTEFSDAFNKYIVGDVLADIIFRFGSLNTFIDDFLLKELATRYEVQNIVLYSRSANTQLTNILQSFELNTTDFFKQNTMKKINPLFVFRSFDKRNFNLNINNLDFFNNIFSFTINIKIR